MKKAQGLLALIGLVFLLAYQILSSFVELIIENRVVLSAIVLVVLSLIAAFFLYTEAYFNGKKFKAIKTGITGYIEESNQLNNYIENLKSSYVNIEATNYGSSELNDRSKFNYKRESWNNSIRNRQTYNCSLAVCKNADNQPIKYLCKYFDIPKDESSLSRFEKVLNDFISVEQGKQLIQSERQKILKSIANSIPILVREFRKKSLMTRLGFETVDITEKYIPKFIFQYVSPGGNSIMEVVISLNIDNLNQLIEFLNNSIKWRKSVAGQRALMTSSLREEIKERDSYKCCSCGIGISDEPNLLLEIDHIKPLSKGGLTERVNLQTLCWKCNRSKGASFEE